MCCFFRFRFISVVARRLKITKKGSVKHCAMKSNLSEQQSTKYYILAGYQSTRQSSHLRSRHTDNSSQVSTEQSHQVQSSTRRRSCTLKSVKVRCTRGSRRHFLIRLQKDGRWNQLDQKAVDAINIIAFKSKLDEFRYSRMGFFMDQFAEPPGGNHC